MPHASALQLILLLPLAGAVVNGLLPLFIPALRRREGLVALVGTGVVLAAFVLALGLFLGYGGEPITVSFYRWMTAGDFSVDFAYTADSLSLLMTLIITGIGTLIHLYSVAYMKGDDGFWRFFAYLNLFIFAMLNLVLGANMPVLFLGWEGVGLASYLLIGFWYKERKNSAAATKAFVVNRVGDFAFLLAMFLIFKNVGTLNFAEILDFARTAVEVPTWVPWAVLLMFIGATGKSAQIPLFVWLPDAMAGPTPVSALIHAATMVTSGLYLLARVSPLVLMSPTVMAVIGIVGALTAIMAATVALTQYDIKKVLAYSTVSQLGFMFMAAGSGAFFVAIFHVMTHAFFKACLFLGSGSVIHAMHHVEHELYPHHGHGDDAHDTHGHDAHGHGVDSDAEAHDSAAKVEAGPNHPAVDDHGQTFPLPYAGAFDAQDMRTMGGLARHMPVTNWTFLLATAAIAGIPLFSGFFSKDEILFRAFEHGYAGHAYAWFVWIVGLVTALLTAFYMTRAYVLTFRGTERWPEAHRVKAHESPWQMTIPLLVLAFLSVVGGFIGLPHILIHADSWLMRWLVGEHGIPVADSVRNGVGAQAVAHAGAPGADHGAAAGHGAAHVPDAITWGLLALGAAIAIVGVLWAWRAYSTHGLAYDVQVRERLGGLYRRASEKWNWDEFYDRTIRRLVIWMADRSAAFDRDAIDGWGVGGFARSARDAASDLRRLQTGFVQTYALAIVLGVVLVLALILLA